VGKNYPYKFSFMATAAQQRKATKVNFPAIVDETIDDDDMTRKYVYVLARKNDELGMVFNGRTNKPIKEKLYPPYRNLLTTCFINWDGSDGKPRGKRLLRYYDGCTTLFADEQPQDKDLIELYLKQTQPRRFLNGFLEIYGYERMLKKYMDMTGYNVESDFRTHVAPAIFILQDAESDSLITIDEMDLLDKALQYAKEATDTKMVIHSRYLGVAEYDLMSGNKLSMKALRANYRKFAKENAKLFADSFQDNSIETKYLIQQALNDGKINTTNFPNKAVWENSGVEICEISGLKSISAISEKIFEETQSSDVAEEFVIQIKALYK
jgi:hypothetical protein